MSSAETLKENVRTTITKMNESIWQNSKLSPSEQTYTEDLNIDPMSSFDKMDDTVAKSHLTLIVQLKENLKNYIKKRFEDQREKIRVLEKQVSNTSSNTVNNQAAIAEYRKTIKEYEAMFRESKRLLEELDKEVVFATSDKIKQE